MSEIRPLEQPAELAELIATQPLQPFLQSWAWGEFQRSLGRRMWRLGAFEDDQLVGAALVVEHALMFGKTYLYCPRGPVAHTRETLLALIEAIHKLGDEQKAMYCKIDPGLYSFSFDRRDWPADVSMGTPLQPAITQALDLPTDAATVLAAMHQKTRYNIRLAEKKGVQVRWSTDDRDLETFLMLIQQTYARQGIRSHPTGYYRKMWRVLREAKMGELVMGELDGQPLAANLIVWHGQTATYLYGGSADHDKHIMAPYLLQWRTIERAISRGVKVYDFWGIAPNDAPMHKWAGVTRFKKGFGGRVVTFPPAMNSILQPAWYQAYRLAKRMRGGMDA